MKKLLLLILLSLSLNVFSQDLSPRDSIKVENLEQESKDLKRDGFVSLGVGGFIHLISIIQLKEGLEDPLDLNPFLIYTAVALGFDGLALYKFSKSRKIKKEIKLIRKNY